MQKYLTIKEAASLSGHSEYEIRQWTQAQYARQEAQQVEQQALEAAQQAQQLIELIELVKKEKQTAHPNSPMRYVIAEDTVISVFGKKETTSSTSENMAEPQAQQPPQQAQQEAQQPPEQGAIRKQQVEDSRDAGIISFLQEQLREKDYQIRERDKQIHNLSGFYHDVREENKKLRLAIEAPQSVREVVLDDEEGEGEVQGEQRTQAEPQSMHSN